MDKATRKWIKEWEDDIERDYVVKCGPVVDVWAGLSYTYWFKLPDPDRMEHDA